MKTGITADRDTYAVLPQVKPRRMLPVLSAVHTVNLTSLT